MKGAGWELLHLEWLWPREEAVWNIPQVQGIGSTAYPLKSQHGNLWLQLWGGLCQEIPPSYKKEVPTFLELNISTGVEQSCLWMD